MITASDGKNDSILEILNLGLDVKGCYVMGMKVPLASSGLRQPDIDAVMKVLQSGKLTMGNEVKKFEQKMSEYLGSKHFVMVNSGSSANLLMIEALMRPAVDKPRLYPGDSILVPAIAWPTTIWPLIQLGLNPLFVDIDPQTLAIDLHEAQRLIVTSRIPVRGIFPYTHSVKRYLRVS